MSVLIAACTKPVPAHSGAQRKRRRLTASNPSIGLRSRIVSSEAAGQGPSSGDSDAEPPTTANKLAGIVRQARTDCSGRRCRHHRECKPSPVDQRRWRRPLLALRFTPSLSQPGALSTRAVNLVARAARPGLSAGASSRRWRHSCRSWVKRRWRSGSKARPAARRGRRTGSPSS